MLGNLAERLQGALNRLSGRGKLTEADVDQALREVRLALLEADVNFKVVKDFVGRIRERAVGEAVLKSLTPGQQVIKVVNDELTQLMGGTKADLVLGSKRPAVVLLCGLQGAGKTTAAAKLAMQLKAQGRRPLLVAADVYRPAAIQQLQIGGERAEVPVFELGTGVDPAEIAAAGVQKAEALGRDVVIVDTAGRAHVDAEMMDEIERVAQAVSPVERLFVADAWTGQEAVNVALAFHERLKLTGVILTKLDSDARGGAALSIRAVTGLPIKFVGLSEKLEPLDVFHPDRMASRILGMGDVLGLIEKAQGAIDQEQAQRMAQKLQSAEFDLDDFLEQLQQIKKMGGLQDLMGMIPGLGGRLKSLPDSAFDGRELVRVEAIIRSMTRGERRRPDSIDASRRRRIAKGSGTQVQDVNRVLKQFDQMRSMMKQFSSLNKGRGGKQARRLMGRMFTK
ncbi:MAG TPA: signal recognition particle protein [Limnochordia bacterium]|nr:signal recognition particle protein [Limnochordia bacterium]